MRNVVCIKNGVPTSHHDVLILEKIIRMDMKLHFS